MDLIGIGVVLMAAGFAGGSAFMFHSTLRTMTDLPIVHTLAFLDGYNKAMTAKHPSSSD